MPWICSRIRGGGQVLDGMPSWGIALLRSLVFVCFRTVFRGTGLIDGFVEEYDLAVRASSRARPPRVGNIGMAFIDAGLQSISLATGGCEVDGFEPLEILVVPALRQTEMPCQRIKAIIALRFHCCRSFARHCKRLDL